MGRNIIWITRQKHKNTLISGLIGGSVIRLPARCLRCHASDCWGQKLIWFAAVVSGFFELEIVPFQYGSSNHYFRLDISLFRTRFFSFGRTVRWRTNQNQSYLVQGYWLWKPNWAEWATYLKYVPQSDLQPTTQNCSTYWTAHTFTLCNLAWQVRKMIFDVTEHLCFCSVYDDAAK